MHHKKRVSDEFSHQPFKDLKKLLKVKESGKNTHLAPLDRGELAPKADKSIGDEELFNDAMKEVREIREFREIPVHQKRVAPASGYKNSSADHEALNVLEEIVSGRRPIPLADTQEYVEWINKDYRRDIIKELHTGRYSVQDCLDLHGIVVDDAESEVEQFFNESVKKGHRCIKIIHGRGRRSPKGPVIKQSLITWLLRRHRKNIIAFVTARQCDGGLGALYVLLR
ncbi:MAG: Smr/MutS family protein [Nitrospirae bacterium]|nr:Smr/MutS family protein [Nitrospirota bacterium]